MITFHCFSMLANNDFHPDSPIKYTVEEGEISLGQTSPAETVVDTSVQNIGCQDHGNAPSPRGSAPPPRNLVVQIDNPADQPIRFKTISQNVSL